MIWHDDIRIKTPSGEFLIEGAKMLRVHHASDFRIPERIKEENKERANYAGCQE